MLLGFYKNILLFQFNSLHIWIRCSVCISSPLKCLRRFLLTCFKIVQFSQSFFGSSTSEGCLTCVQIAVNAVPRHTLQSPHVLAAVPHTEFLAHRQSLTHSEVDFFPMLKCTQVHFTLIRRNQNKPERNK